MRWLAAVAVLLTGLVAVGPANALGPITIGEGAGPGSPYPSTLEVSGYDRIIEGTQVRVDDLVHAFPDELDIALTGPDGRTIMLMSDTGESGGACDAPDLQFSMTATGPVPASPLLCSGVYLPTDDDSDSFDSDVFPAPAPAEPFVDSLSVFNGSFPNGSWSLRVVDDTFGDGGSIGDWRPVFDTRLTGRVGLPRSPTQVPESQPSIMVSLERTGGSAAAPLQSGSVTWTTETCPAPLAPAPAYAPALAGEDFATTGGVVSFEPGQTAASLEIPLIDDGVPEDLECFALRLTSAAGDARYTTTATPTTIRLSSDDRRASPPAVVSVGRQRVLRTKAVLIAATSASHGTLSATGVMHLPAKAAARVRLTPARPRAVTAKQRVMLKLRLSRSALRAVRKAFKRKRVLVASLKVKATDLAGGRATRSLTVKLRR